MLRFDYASPSASSPLLPLSLHASINDDLLDDILSHLTAISFASAACVSKSWNQICSRILAHPKVASALSLHPSPKVAVKEVIERVLGGSIRPRFVVANIGSGFGLYDISKFVCVFARINPLILISISEHVVCSERNLFCPFL
ncbi:unnamed protein product [Malus baccata var. baccata]